MGTTTRKRWTSDAHGRGAALSVALGALFLLAGGCSTEGVLGPDLDAVCLASVQVQGRLFVHEPDADLPEGFVPGPPVGSVLRNVECRDTVEPDDPAGDRGSAFERDGDAIGLPVGTTLHPVGDGPTVERLTARLGGAFIVLVAEVAEG